MTLTTPHLHVWHVPRILAIPKNAQDEHDITFSKGKVFRESQRWVALHNFLELLPVEESGVLRSCVGEGCCAFRKVAGRLTGNEE